MTFVISSRSCLVQPRLLRQRSSDIFRSSSWRREVCHPLPASNVTPATLFRSVEKYRPTLLIDEADSFLKGNDELRGILNSGHTRAMGFILRSAGDDHEPRQFNTFAPKIIAQIKQLPATLEDRSITIPMSRKRTSERVERLQLSKLRKECRTLRQKCLRWAKDQEPYLKEARPDIAEDLNDRAWDNWEPLLAIADVCGHGDKARTAALELSGQSPEENEIGVLLLTAIREILDNQNIEKIASRTSLISSPNGKKNRGRPGASKGRKSPRTLWLDC